MLWLGYGSQGWEGDCRKEQSLSHREATRSAQKNTPLSAPLPAELVFHLEGEKWGWNTSLATLRKTLQYPQRRFKSSIIISGKWIALLLDLAASCFGNPRYHLKFLFVVSLEEETQRLQSLWWGSASFANCLCQTMPFTLSTKSPLTCTDQKIAISLTPILWKQYPALQTRTACVSPSHWTTKYRDNYCWFIHKHPGCQT